MTDQATSIWDRAGDFHSLFQTPGQDKEFTHRAESFCPSGTPRNGQSPTEAQAPVSVKLAAALLKLLYDIITYPYSPVSTRIKRLGRSGRGFENTKRQGLEQGFIIESSAGPMIYLIPTKKTFAAFDMPSPYERAASVEHSFYVNAMCMLLKQDPRYRKVIPEAKIGSSSATADGITIAQDGTRQAWEMTLSTGNILSNATKYVQTDFVQIVFLCRDYKLREAVKACCREGQLDPHLLSKLEYLHLGALVRRQRKNYRY